jgi:hypothetical protein
LIVCHDECSSLDFAAYPFIFGCYGPSDTERALFERYPAVSVFLLHARAWFGEHV